MLRLIWPLVVLFVLESPELPLREDDELVRESESLSGWSAPSLGEPLFGLVIALMLSGRSACSAES